MWTPHARCHTAGTLYTTDGYLCFSSREEGSCILLIPLSEVQHLQHSLTSWFLTWSNRKTSRKSHIILSGAVNNTEEAPVNKERLRIIRINQVNWCSASLSPVTSFQTHSALRGPPVVCLLCQLLVKE